jgi:hypothetical protein
MRSLRAEGGVLAVAWVTQVASGSRPKIFDTTPSYSEMNRDWSFCVLPTPPGNL